MHYANIDFNAYFQVKKKQNNFTEREVYSSEAITSYSDDLSIRKQTLKILLGSQD